jgi:replication factor A1
MMGASDRKNTNFHPISSLNPYQNKWVIKARVTMKSQMRTWTNQRGEGKLFSIELLDEHGGAIRATMFNDAADKFDQILQEGKVYTFSKGNLKPANKKYCKLPHDYEIHLNRDAEVNFYGEDNAIKTQQYDFRPIAQIAQMDAESTIDICAVITQVSDLSTIVSQRTQKELTKRVLTVCDSSNASIELTLWNAKAEEVDEKCEGSIITMKACRISDWNGKSLSTSFSSVHEMNPNIPEAKTLRGWYQANGGNNIMPLSEGRGGGGSGKNQRYTINEIKDMRLGLNEEKVDYFDLRGTIQFIKHDSERPPWYNACPKDGCNKKVNPEGEDTYRCEKCDKEYPNCSQRYILSLLITDAGGGQWVTVFNDEAESLLGKTAKELQGFLDMGNEDEFNKVFKDANFKSYIFSCRAKADNHNDELRCRVTVSKAKPIDSIVECKYVMEEIEKYEAK